MRSREEEVEGNVSSIMLLRVKGAVRAGEEWVERSARLPGLPSGGVRQSRKKIKDFL